MKPHTILAASFAFITGTGVVFADHHKSGDDKSVVADEPKDIMTITAGSENFTTLLAAINAAGLAETLKGEGPFTVFAPTNSAFEALPEGMVVKLLEPANKEMLTNILTYHVVPKKLLSENIAPMTLATVGGPEVTITLDGETVMIDGAKVIEADIIASNGVIHVVDKVLTPPVEAEEDAE